MTNTNKFSFTIAQPVKNILVAISLSGTSLSIIVPHSNAQSSNPLQKHTLNTQTAKEKSDVFSHTKISHSNEPPDISSSITSQKSIFQAFQANSNLDDSLIQILPGSENDKNKLITTNSKPPQNTNPVVNKSNSSIYAQAPETNTPAPDKSQYNLFNPTPPRLWRDFSTGRPDKTENPFTIDAGRFSMEADLFVYTQSIDRSNDTFTESFNYIIPTFKIGLTNNIDLQVVPELFNTVRTKVGTQPSQTISGYGDTTVRLKVNLWGNDGGKTAFGIVPFIKFPTSQNGIGNSSIEGGIIFPFAISLSEQWDLGLQTEFDLNRNNSDTGYDIGFVNSLSLGYKISDRWSTYFEFYTNTGAERGFAATFDTGIKYLLTENIQLDAGVNVGLTEAADSFQPFVGMSIRF
jgi:Putative MetA-pathway of phenol degradation